tara:strand:- start:77 stop:337 length:261 start_codon:yes stop_codon:yes gene_type:complete
MSEDGEVLNTERYKACEKDNFYIKIEPSRFPADDRRGEIVSIFKKRWLFDKRIKSVIITQGDEGEELMSTIASMYNDLTKYIKYEI